jgi:hypothetical protein
MSVRGLRGFPKGSGPSGVQWGSSGKKPQEEPGREKGRGVRGKDQPPNSPQREASTSSLKKFSYFS